MLFLFFIVYAGGEGGNQLLAANHLQIHKNLSLRQYFHHRDTENTEDTEQQIVSNRRHLEAVGS
jgi:hypothetical protein